MLSWKLISQKFIAMMVIIGTNAFRLSGSQKSEMREALIRLFDSEGTAMALGISSPELADKTIRSFESKLERKGLELRGIYLN